MQNIDLKDKVVLVTGGTTGMGYATAKAFGEHGAKVVIAGRRLKEGEEAAAAIRALGTEVTFVQTDVSVEGQVKALIERAVELYGRLDVAFNNAGLEGAWKPLDETSEEEYDTVMDANFKGVWRSVKYEMLQFKKQNSGGVIVNTSSWLAHGIFPGSAIYSASKAAMDSLTRSIAIEGAPFGIRANNINPGYIDTPLSDRMIPSDDIRLHLNKHVPLARQGKPEEIADVVLWLSSPASSYVTGQNLLVDGGLAIPGQRL